MTTIRLKKLHLDIHIHLLTIIYALLSWSADCFVWYLSALTIVCIHESCHLMMAYYFQFDIEKIEILPFGAYLSIRDFFFHPISHELCVVLAGPCSHLLIFEIIGFFFNGPLKQDLFVLNSFVFFFNLLPIFPMDGHRIISLILQSFLDLKEAMHFSLKISVFSFAILFVFYLKLNTIVMIVYLFLQQIEYEKYIYNYLRDFYSKIPTLYERTKIKVNDSLIYRRGYHNYYLIDEKLYDEKNMSFVFLKKIK